VGPRPPPCRQRGGGAELSSISNPDVPLQGASQSQKYLQCLFDGNYEYLTIYCRNGKVAGYNCNYPACGETECNLLKRYPIGSDDPNKSSEEALGKDKQTSELLDCPKPSNV